MRVACLVLVIVACSPSKPRDASDYVALCAPGRAIKPCLYAVERIQDEPKPALPTNDLVRIDMEGASLFDARLLVVEPTRGAFKHTMVFRDGYGTVRSRVLELIVARLGAPTRIKGSPPIQDPACPGGDYWVASDGIWILSDTRVTWYSKPFEGLTHDDLFPWDEKFIHPTPEASALWRKIGHVLITY